MDYWRGQFAASESPIEIEIRLDMEPNKYVNSLRMNKLASPILKPVEPEEQRATEPN